MNTIFVGDHVAVTIHFLASIKRAWKERRSQFLYNIAILYVWIPTADVLNISTEVHVFYCTGQTDRAVYWTVPHTFEKELWLEPWPDDRSDRTGACLSRPTSHFKTYGRARIHFGRAGRSDTYLGELHELSELNDTTLELDELNGLSDTSLDMDELSNTEDRAGSAAGRNGHFQPKEKIVSFQIRPALSSVHFKPFSSRIPRGNQQISPGRGYIKRQSKFHHIQVNIPQNRWTCESYQATTRDPSFGGLVSHIKHQLKSGISEDFRNLRATLQSTSSPSGVHIQIEPVE
ncbi:hypothetical protein YC2023_037176 [Brassica napus]